MTATAKSHQPTRLVDLQIRDFPLRLKKALQAAADERETSMNEVAVRTLAKRFKVAYTPSERRPTRQSNSDIVMFAMPAELRQRIKVAAAQQGIYQRELVLSVLSRQFLKKGVA